MNLKEKSDSVRSQNESIKHESYLDEDLTLVGVVVGSCEVWAPINSASLRPDDRRALLNLPHGRGLCEVQGWLWVYGSKFIDQCDRMSSRM